MDELEEGGNKVRMKEPTHIPDTLQKRMNLRKTLRGFVQAKSLCPPVSLRQLETLAKEFFSEKGIDDNMLPWIMVEINNQLWVDIIATIPSDRRLLMLPKCLS